MFDMDHQYLQVPTASMIETLDQQDNQEQQLEQHIVGKDMVAEGTNLPGLNEVHILDSESKVRFWNEYTISTTTTSGAALQSSPIPSTTAKPIAVTKSTGSKPGLEKGSIAAVVVISLLTFFCLAYLGYWYVARECKGRRRRRLHASDNPFDQSSVTLGDETSRTLGEFLMKDVEPERTSIMFSRSRSPSIAYTMDGADRRSSKTSRNSYEAALHSVLKMDPLAGVSTEDTRPSFIISELTDSSGSKSDSKSSSSASKSTSTQQASTSDETPSASSLQSSSPRTSLTSNVLPSPTRSSQLWVTTSAETTEMSSFMSDDHKSPRSSISSYNAHMLPSYASSQLPSRSQHASNASHSSSLYASQTPMRSMPRTINDFGNSRRNHARTYSTQSRSMTISPIAESVDLSPSSQEDSLSSTAPTSMFRFSDV